MQPIILNPYPKTKKEIASAIAELKQQIHALEDIHTGCQTCTAFSEKTGCARAGGQTPPPEILPIGCPEWEWDEIPF